MTLDALPVKNRQYRDDSRLDSYSPGQNLRVDMAARLLGSGRRLLDVGCGYGVLGRALEGRFAQVFGVDISSEAVERASKNGTTASQLDVGSAPMPFPAAYFDAVTFLSAIAYVSDPRYVIRECWRVLRPGGALLVSTANMRSAGKLWRLFVRGRFPATSKGITTGYDGGAIHFFCSLDLQHLLMEAGFQLTSNTGIFYGPRFLCAFANTGAFHSLTREFLAGEVLVSARKPGSPDVG